jgi:hypothetical protein
LLHDQKWGCPTLAAGLDCVRSPDTASRRQGWDKRIRHNHSGVFQILPELYLAHILNSKVADHSVEKERSAKRTAEPDTSPIICNDRYVFCKNPDPGEVGPPFTCQTKTQPQRTTETLSCPVCDHVYNYTQSNIRVLDPAQVPNLSLGKAPTLGIVEFSCAAQNCGTRVRILRPTPASVPTKQVGTGREQWKLINVHCKKGHLITAIPSVGHQHTPKSPVLERWHNPRLAINTLRSDSPANGTDVLLDHHPQLSGT